MHKQPLSVTQSKFVLLLRHFDIFSIVDSIWVKWLKNWSSFRLSIKFLTSTFVYSNLVRLWLHEPVWRSSGSCSAAWWTGIGRTRWPRCRTTTWWPDNFLRPWQTDTGSWHQNDEHIFAVNYSTENCGWILTCHFRHMMIFHLPRWTMDTNWPYLESAGSFLWWTVIKMPQIEQHQHLADIYSTVRYSKNVFNCIGPLCCSRRASVPPAWTRGSEVRWSCRGRSRRWPDWGWTSFSGPASAWAYWGWWSAWRGSGASRGWLWAGRGRAKGRKRTPAFRCSIAAAELSEIGKVTWRFFHI